MPSRRLHSLSRIQAVRIQRKGAKMQRRKDGRRNFELVRETVFSHPRVPTKAGSQSLQSPCAFAPLRLCVKKSAASLRFSLLLLLLSWQTVRAQLIPADDFFHEGAQSYITNNVAKAREAVDQGLKFYPEDTKLKKLDELLKQKNQQQQQNQQQKEQQQSQSDQQKDQNKKPEQKDQKKPEPSPDKKDQKDAQQPQKEQKPDESKEPKPDEQGKDGQMSPAEAKKLLDGQKNDEKLMPVSRKDKPPDQQKAIKDW